MQVALRQSVPAKIVASGFIVVIIFGNFWLVKALMGQTAPGWMQAGFALGIIFTFIGGILLLALKVQMRLVKPDDADEIPRDEG